jgi:hypothetical protein
VLDGGFAFEVLQLDAQLRMGAGGVLRETADVALALENFQNAGAQLGSGRKDGSFFACCPLRMRVSISPRGSVKAIEVSLPARLGHAGDQALVGQITQLNTAQAELAIIAARAGGGAAVANARRVRVARDFRQLQTGDQTLGIISRLVSRHSLQLGILRGILLNEGLARSFLLIELSFAMDLSSLS